MVLSRCHFLGRRTVMEILLFIVEEKSAAIVASSFEPAEVLISSIQGTSSTKRASSLRAVFSVSSIRVPRWSLTVTERRPLSCCCMKSVPIRPVITGNNESPKIPKIARIVTVLWRRHQPSDCAYQPSILSSIRTTVLSYQVFLSASSSMRLPSSSTCTFFALNNLEHNIGVKEMATKVEVQHTTVTIHPSSWNIIPAMPFNIVNGTNTATSTSVVAITDTHTSFVA